MRRSSRGDPSSHPRLTSRARRAPRSVGRFRQLDAARIGVACKIIKRRGRFIAFRSPTTRSIRSAVVSNRGDSKRVTPIALSVPNVTFLIKNLCLRPRRATAMFRAGEPRPGTATRNLTATTPSSIYHPYDREL